MGKRHSLFYPLNEWKIIEDTFDPVAVSRNETVFSLGNGYIGLRGNFEEGTHCYQRGTYVNGFFDSAPITYSEAQYGFARNSQTIVNVADGMRIELYIDDEPFDLAHGTLLSYCRTLDMRTGILVREVDWRSLSGKRIKLCIRRMVPLFNKHLVAIDYHIKLLDKAVVTLCSSIDGKVQGQTRKKSMIDMLENDFHYTSDGGQQGQTNDDDSYMCCSISNGQNLRLKDRQLDGTYGALHQVTQNTRFDLVCAMENDLRSRCRYTTENEEGGLRVAVKFRINMGSDDEAKLSKYLAYYTSQDYSTKNLFMLAHKTVIEARNHGFASLVEKQKRCSGDFWERSDVIIKGDVWSEPQRACCLRCLNNSIC